MGRNVLLIYPPNALYETKFFISDGATNYQWDRKIERYYKSHIKTDKFRLSRRPANQTEAH